MSLRSALPERHGVGADPLKRWGAATVSLAVAALVLTLLFRETLGTMVATWRDSELYAYGFLIAPVAGFLCWRRRRALAPLTLVPCVWGLGIVVLAAVAWQLGAAAGVLVVQQFAVVVLFQALVLTVLGLRVSRVLAVPLLYLLFAVPFGSFLIPPLQDLTARFTVLALQLAGVPLRADGWLLHIPGASFVVAEACAGLRFLLSALALSVLAADLFYRSRARWLAFLVLALVVPVIANGLRAASIILIAYWRGPEAAVQFDHVTYGVVFLGFVLLCLFALGLTFRDSRSPAPAARAVVAPAVVAPAGARAPWSFAFAALGVLGVAAGIVWAGAGQPTASVAPGRVVLDAPSIRPPWRPASETGQGWRPEFPGAHGELRRSFVRGDLTVDFYVAYYAYQSQGAEVVGETNRLGGGDGWVSAEAGERPATVDGASLTLGTHRFLSAGVSRGVWYWYWVDGRFTSNPYVAKALQVKARFLGGVNAAAVVALATEDGDSREVAQVLGDFLAHLGSIRAVLERAAKSGARP